MLFLVPFSSMSIFSVSTPPVIKFKKNALGQATNNIRLDSRKSTFYEWGYTFGTVFFTTYR